MINDHIICAIMATTVYSDALICTQALQLPTHNLRPVVENSAEGLSSCRLDKIMPGKYEKAKE